MKSIRNNNESIIIINKSKFICNLIKVTSELDAIEKINNIKTKYKDATHNCYAYIINNKMKFSDDKEPNGTAGMPILNVLKNKKLDNILCVVTRYFGGIKLGAGGLVRAYTNSVTNCLKDNNICEYIKGIETIIAFDISAFSPISTSSIIIELLIFEYLEILTFGERIHPSTFAPCISHPSDIKEFFAKPMALSSTEVNFAGGKL